MDQELKEMLNWINENLKAVVTNQAEIYVKLEKLEKKINEEPKSLMLTPPAVAGGGFFDYFLTTHSFKLNQNQKI